MLGVDMVGIHKRNKVGVTTNAVVIILYFLVLSFQTKTIA